MEPDVSGGAKPLRLVGAQPEAVASSFPIVGIGASAGGLEAASALLRHLPPRPGMAFVLIQHLDPSHESGLTSILSRVTTLPVREAADEMVVEVDHVYVIPPGKAMVLRDGRLHTTPRATTREPQRLVDHFLQSLADERADRCMGVVLSGTGSDGAEGLATIKAQGGVTFAQDASAGHAGMPLSAVAAGGVDFVLPPEGIAVELVRLRAHAAADEPLASTGSGEEDALARIFGALRSTSGVDFSHYKQGTVRRRIDRRMRVRQATALDAYARLVEASHSEAKALHEDILIHVTSFFRDPDTFAALAAVVFPAIVEGRPAAKPLRIWVPGCSTGEEVYSLAISLLEFLGERAATFPIKLFGTDVSDAVVARARAGHFRQHAVADVSPERLRRFFVPAVGGYQVSKSVRDLCVFARQDATRDPPFSKLDLVSCRNVLIYLGPELQARVLPIFHYALEEGGFLVLGKSEAVGAASDLFAVVDARQGIHVRKSVPSRLRFDGQGGRRPGAILRATEHAAATRPASVPDVVRGADRLVLARAPAGVVIDESMAILQFRGDTGSYLSPAPGAPTNDLLKMAREGLLPDLREAIEEAKRSDAPVVRKGVGVKADECWHHVDVEVLPIRLPHAPERCLLVQFQPPGGAISRHDAESVGDRTARAEAGGGDGARVQQLARELAATKDYLQSIIAEQHAAAEQLETANEEILSSNEELQSANEELETAKEELQATNEELMTVNEEMQVRNREAILLSDDLTNVLTSASISIVLMGRDLRIRRFTPAAGKLLSLTPSDLGRPITDVAPRLRLQDLEQLLTQVLSTLQPCEREVQDLDERWHLLAVWPYRTQDDKIDGAVLSLSDIDGAKRSEQRVAAARDYAESIVTSVHEPLVVLDAELRVRTANRAFHRAFGTTPAETEGRAFFALRDGLWNLAGLPERLAAVVDHAEPVEDLEIEVDLPGSGRRTLVLDARPVSGTSAGETLVLIAIDDVTERRRDREEKRQLERKVQDTQKLESLGIMAGGIAHDFNNILTGILGHANLAEMDAPPSSELRGHLERIDEGVHRAADLCTQMLAYAGRGRFVVEPCDLSALVRDATRLVDVAIGPDVVLSFALAPGLPPVLADATQVRQVVMNLVVNAAEAMGEAGGTVTLTTGLVRADRAYLTSAVLAPSIPEGQYAYVQVADDGMGMDETTLARIFDPFFTTKFTGRGLGLAAVLGIVRGHGGALKVESALGRGTTFRLLLPCLEHPVATEPARVPAEATSSAGRGVVLVVDDEDGVRGVVAKLLESMGFDVVEARSGLEAVAAFRDDEREFRLVLLDMTMPGLSGQQTYDRLREVREDARVVLMSGYSEQDAMQRFWSKGLAGFLRKPFGRSELVARLDEVLEGSPE